MGRSKSAEETRGKVEREGRESQGVEGSDGNSKDPMIRSPSSMSSPSSFQSSPLTISTISPALIGVSPLIGGHSPNIGIGISISVDNEEVFKMDEDEKVGFGSNGKEKGKGRELDVEESEIEKKRRRRTGFRGFNGSVAGSDISIESAFGGILGKGEFGGMEVVDEPSEVEGTKDEEVKGDVGDMLRKFSMGLREEREDEEEGDGGGGENESDEGGLWSGVAGKFVRIVRRAAG